MARSLFADKKRARRYPGPFCFVPVEDLDAPVVLVSDANAAGATDRRPDAAMKFMLASQMRPVVVGVDNEHRLAGTAGAGRHGSSRPDRHPSGVQERSCVGTARAGGVRAGSDRCPVPVEQVHLAALTIGDESVPVDVAGDCIRLANRLSGHCTSASVISPSAASTNLKRPVT